MHIIKKRRGLRYRSICLHPTVDCCLHVLLHCFSHYVNCSILRMHTMEESKVIQGAVAMEQLANTIVPQHFSTHLCESTKDRRFRAMFGTSSRTAFLLWTMIDVDRDGPKGGLRLHMLWMLLFLKGYPNGETLSGICGATPKTVRFWVDAFLERVSNLKVVNTTSLSV